jgi:hypothetical protein
MPQGHQRSIFCSATPSVLVLLIQLRALLNFACSSFASILPALQCHSCTEQVWLALKLQSVLAEDRQPTRNAAQTSFTGTDYAFHAHIASHVQALALCRFQTAGM